MMTDDLSGSSAEDSLPLITLRIPGPWETTEQLRDSLAKFGDGFVIPQVDAGEAIYLLHEKTRQKFEITAARADDELAEVFAGNPRNPPQVIRALQRHKVKVFITGPGGSTEAARKFLAIGKAFVKAGALGVMVDNSGNTHSPRDWLDLANDPKMGGMYWAFVSVTGARDVVFSAGMHCLGFRDAEIPDPTDPQQDGMALHEFNGYSYQSGATILDGEAIGGPDGAEFTLRHVECTRFPKGSPWHNPYGVWRLEKFQADQD